jgi:hypothetical protein
MSLHLIPLSASIPELFGLLGGWKDSMSSFPSVNAVDTTCIIIDLGFGRTRRNGKKNEQYLFSELQVLKYSLQST